LNIKAYFRTQLEGAAMKEACGCANIGTEGEVGGQNVGVYGDEGTGVLVGADKEGKK
jgi:hypothetical protein